MKRLSEQNLYEILEVPPDAAPSAIEVACERAQALYAPGSLAIYSLVTADEGALLASRIEEARRTLLDPEARARYDAALSAAPSPAPPAAGAGPRGRRGRPGALPPVIPALASAPPAEPPRSASASDPDPATDPEPPGRPDPDGAPEPPAARPAELLASAAGAAGPAGGRPAPILLEREIKVDEAAIAASEPPDEEEGWISPASPPASRPRIALTRVVGAEPRAPAAHRPVAAAAHDVPMPEGSVWTGEALRKVREARGISLQQIAERTKVTRHHVENIEADRFPSLPAAVYLRGILVSLARELRLDGQRVARSYLERATAARSAQHGEP